MHVSEPMRAADLALHGPVGLALDSAGRPGRPVLLVDLDAPLPDAMVDPAAEAAGGSLPMLVGMTTRRIRPPLRPLVEALDLTLCTDPDGGRSCVAVADLDEAVEMVSAVAAESPRAAVVLGHVLRETAPLDVRSGLAAEAAAYSMLLGGPEFARWLERRGPPRAAPARLGSPVAVARSADVLELTLQRPDRRNAMDAALREALVEALTVAVADPDLRVEIRGAGPDFCSGGDLDEFGTATDYVAAYLVRVERHPGWLLDLLGSRTTVMVHGACIGAGVEMPAFAGRVVAAPDSTFALPEVAMGLVPGAGGTVSIPRRIGRWRTAWMALTGIRVDAATALAWGLVDDVEGSA